MRIGIVNGPNLGRLGQRQPEVYGHLTLAALEEHLRSAFPEVTFLFFQSNHEGEIIDRLESWHNEGVRHLVINPGALTHQSYVLRDCLLGLEFRAIEVHLSNIYQRESFRAHSLVAPAVQGQISGLGEFGYHLAVRYLLEKA
ncbi:3-dehydroquinate dehydratase [Sulfobacillus sp. DSM 109850]|uniref:3-dehydroquinate dehydratase n=2 Tax=Sulfobacillus harzensis TaxID=2729629 RepID=A0A7Y0L2G7_9FIRM|nr:3-dehydroquinate dehydratase [Sulfobacillus harzensis]